MNRHEYLSEARFYLSTARDWIKAHPYISGAVAIAVLSFALGAYAFAAVTCKGDVPGTLVCTEDGGPAIPPVQPPIPQPIPDTCPAGTLRINNQFGKSAIDTGSFGSFGSNIMVIEVKVPADFAGSKQRTSSWVEFGAGSVARHAVLSTVPCDFSAANAVKTGSGSPMISVNQIRFSFVYSAVAGMYNAKLEPGKTYYINVKNAKADGSPTCSIDDCRMRGSLPN